MRINPMRVRPRRFHGGICRVDACRGHRRRIGREQTVGIRSCSLHRCRIQGREAASGNPDAKSRQRSVAVQRLGFDRAAVKLQRAGGIHLDPGGQRTARFDVGIGHRRGRADAGPVARDHQGRRIRADGRQRTVGYVYRAPLGTDRASTISRSSECRAGQVHGPLGCDHRGMSRGASRAYGHIAGQNSELPGSRVRVGI
ncbi:hypothetical protein D3C87_1448690 [compost metagenome]